MRPPQCSIFPMGVPSMQEYPADYWVRQGARIRSTANDIKRNAEALAEELGEELTAIQDTFAGSAAVEVFERVINKMVETYPLSRLDLDVRRDDTDDGVVVQSPEASLASSRISDRANKLGHPTPYYEYRDAAMSSVGPYRPEWIKELRTVTADDARDPDVAYNSGHLMHQATFFVGPVNFYWKIGDKAYVEQMDTGDSNYITPFIPHSFASRDPKREAYIVAVTFYGKLEGIQRDLMVLDPLGVEEALLDLSNRSRALAGILRRELTDAMLGLEQLTERTGLSSSRLAAFLNGSDFPADFPAMDELAVISEALGTNLRDLLPPESLDPREVVVKHRSPERRWTFPSDEIPRYQVEDLAGCRKAPFLKGMAVRVLEASSLAELDLATSTHEFCYNYGSEPAVLHWQGETGVRNTIVEPGGSYYIKPTVRHALRSISQSATPELVIMRVGSSFYGDGHLELSSYPKEGLRRVLRESQQWYDPHKIGG